MHSSDTEGGTHGPPTQNGLGACVRLLLEEAPAGFYIFTPERFLYVNAEICRIWGYTEEEICSMGPLDITHPDDRDLVREAIRLRFDEGETRQSYSFKGIRKDGRTIHLESSGILTEHQGARVIAGTLVDITERVEHNEAIERRERWFRAIIEHTSDVISVWNKERVPVYRSPSANRVIDAAKSTRMQEFTEELIHPEDLDAIREVSRSVWSTPGEKMCFSCRVRSPTGGWSWIEGLAQNHLDDPDIQGVIVNYRDITDRVAAENAIRASEIRLASIVALAADAIISIDEEQRITLFNEAAERMFGYGAEEAIGKPISMLLPSEHLDFHATAVRDLFKGGSMSRHPRIVQGLRKNGRTFSAEVSLSRLDLGGKAIFTAVARDVSEREAAEAALRESEQRYRLLVQHSPDGIIVHQGPEIRFANPEAARTLTGKTDPAELVGRDITDFLPPSEVALFAPRMDAIHSGTFKEPIETEIVGPDGRVRALIEVHPIGIEFERQPAVLAISRDITDRRRLERIREEQRKSLERIANAKTLGESLHELADLVLILSTVPLGIALCPMGEEENSRHSDCVMKNTLGPVLRDDDIPVPSLVYQDHHERVIRTNALATDPLWADVAESATAMGATAAECHRIRGHGGTQLGGLVLYALTPQDLDSLDPAVVEMVTHTAGVTMERERTGRDLQKARDNLAAIFQASPVAIIALNRRGAVQSWNRAAEELFGLEADDVMGLPFPLLPEEPHRQQELLEQAFGGRSIRSIESRHKRRNGESLVLNVTLAPLGDGDGVLAMVTDESESKRLEAMEAQVQEMERLGALGELAASVSHEVANPLGSILSLSYVLLHKGLELPDEVRSNIALIEEEATRAGSLMRDLLKFTRVPTEERGSTLIDINEVVRRSVTWMNYSMRTSTIRVETNLAAELPRVRGHTSKLIQVLTNLLKNAEEAMRGRGSGVVRITTHVEEGDVVLDVEDSGPGIPYDQMEAIFQPLYTTKTTGTGIGLSLSRQIIEQYGGSLVAIAGNRGNGAHFCIRLPATFDVSDGAERQGESEIADLYEPARRQRREGVRVLVVDDESVLRVALARALRSAGYTVDEATDGEEALDLLRATQYDLACVDIRMPRMPGNTLFKKLGQLPQEYRPDVVFMTGDALTGDTAEFLETSNRPYLTKPFSPSKMLEQLDALLDSILERRALDGPDGGISPASAPDA